MVSDKAVRQAIYTRLNVAPVTANLASGSASLFHAVAPSKVGGATPGYPMVIYNQQSDVVTSSFGGSHFDSQMWQVRAVVQGGSSSAAEDIADAVSDALHFQELNIVGAENMYLARETGITFTEVVNGEQYRHHGHMYRVVVQEP